MDFTASDLTGTPTRLSALRGKVTIVAFWASWCFPCRYELPLLDALYREHRDAGLQVVAVASDDELDAVRAYVDARNFSFPVLFDRAGSVREGFGASAVPATFVLDHRSRPVAFTDPSTGVSATKLDNPRQWKDTATLERLQELLATASAGS